MNKKIRKVTQSEMKQFYGLKAAIGKKAAQVGLLRDLFLKAAMTGGQVKGAGTCWPSQEPGLYQFRVNFTEMTTLDVTRMQADIVRRRVAPAIIKAAEAIVKRYSRATLVTAVHVIKGKHATRVNLSYPGRR